MRKRTIFVTAIPLLAVGTIASAFVAQQISASGRGHTSAAQPVTGEVTGLPDNFAPGQTANIALRVTNPNNYVVHVSDPHFAVADIANCPAGSFTVDHVSGPTDIPTGASNAFTAQVHFVNLPSDEQSGCLDKNIVVSATAS